MNNWSTAELQDELQDANESIAFNTDRLAVAKADLSSLIARTVAWHDTTDRGRWIGDSYHAVKQLEATVDQIAASIAAATEYRAELLAELESRS